MAALSNDKTTRLEQKWNSSFQLLDPRGNIYLLDFDPMNANIAQLFTGCNTFISFPLLFQPNWVGE